MLRPGGRFVASVNHPMRWPFPDSPDPEDLRIVVVLLRPDALRGDRRRAAGPLYVEHHRTVGDWVRAVVGAGLVLEDLVEPEWTPGRTEEWGQWSPARGALVPGTLILVCAQARLTPAVPSETAALVRVPQQSRPEPIAPATLRRRRSLRRAGDTVSVVCPFVPPAAAGRAPSLARPAARGAAGAGVDCAFRRPAGSPDDVLWLAPEPTAPSSRSPER